MQADVAVSAKIVASLPGPVNDGWSQACVCPISEPRGSPSEMPVWYLSCGLSAEAWPLVAVTVEAKDGEGAGEERKGEDRDSNKEDGDKQKSKEDDGAIKATVPTTSSSPTVPDDSCGDQTE